MLTRMLPLALILTSCASTLNPPGMQETLQERRPLYSHASIEELEALEPQIDGPFRLGIAPPVGIHQWGETYGVWSEDERAALEKWAEEAQQAGWITEVEFLSSFLVDNAPSQDSLLLGIREAGARQNVDAVLVIQAVSEDSQWMNALAILDLTLIGAFFAPGHSTEAVAILEGLIVDTRNEYVYAAATGMGETGERTRTLAMIDEATDQARRDARMMALNALGEDLMVQAGRAVTQAAFRRQEP